MTSLFDVVFPYPELVILPGIVGLHDTAPDPPAVLGLFGPNIHTYIDEPSS